MPLRRSEKSLSESVVGTFLPHSVLPGAANRLPQAVLRLLDHS